MPAAPVDQSVSTVSAERSYSTLPLAFEPNGGRMDSGIDFSARSSSGNALITGPGATIGLSQGKGNERSAEAVSLAFIGATDPEPVALERLPGVVNDLRGDDPARWRTELPTYERIRYESIYPGVSLDWHGNQRDLEYDLRLAPGADPGAIAARVKGADELRLAANGDLLIEAGETTLRQHAPVAFQSSASGREPVEASFALKGETVSFRLGAYDASRPVVIDPVLTYSTYLGGNSTDTGRAIAVDSSGSAYVTGETASSDFNTVGPIELDGAVSDVFVSKLNPAGSALTYSTYLGGDGVDRGFGIAVDSSGSAYVVGETASTDFNLVGPIEGDGVGVDAFVSKLSPGGSTLTYSTYLGGGAFDDAQDIAVDSSGSAYVGGRTNSTDFNTVGPIEVDELGSDAYVSKLNPAGSALTYSTYLGGNAGDNAFAIAVDSSGSAYLAGLTDSTDFNTMGAIEGDAAIGDAFVSKLNPAGSALTYSTYLGGGGTDLAQGVAVDSTGSAYVAGRTDSTDFNTVGPIEGDEAGDDVFVSKLNPAGGALTYSTYLGGGGSDDGRAIAVDSSGSAYVTGETASTDFNTVGSIEGDDVNTDAFVSKLNPGGSALTYSTYLGGGSAESANGIAVDSSGSIYITGDTLSADFNTVGPIEADDTLNDAFVSKLTNPLNDDFSTPTMLSGATAGAGGSNVGGLKQAGEPSHAGNAGGASIWHRWTAPSGGDVTIDTCGSDFNTLLAVYTGSAVGALTPLASNDNTIGCGGGGTGSRVTTGVTGGTTYQIAVDGFGGATGNAALSLAFTATPPVVTPPVTTPTATPPATTPTKKKKKKKKKKKRKK